MKHVWIRTTIGEQVTLQRGIDITKAEQNPGNVPVISSGGISSYHDTAAVSGPGVILGRKGVVGSVYYIESDYWPHDTTLWVKDFHGNYPRFVYYFFKYLTPLIATMDVGSANPTLNRNHVHPLQILWPPLPTQRAIAHILGTLDDKIELNRKMNETLEAMAQAIFKSWFVDFDPVRAKMEGVEPAGMDEETAALFPSEFEIVDGREVPKGWRVGFIEDLCQSIENGGTPTRMEPSYWNNGKIPWFKTGEFKDEPLLDSTEKITELGLKESACRLWGKKTILFALYASPTLGRMGILETEATANQACSALTAKEEYGFLFLYYSLLDGRKYLQSIAVGAAQQNINQQVLRTHKTLIPPENLVHKFHSLILPIYLEKVSNLDENSELFELIDTLLPMLLSGELDLTVEEVT